MWEAIGCKTWLLLGSHTLNAELDVSGWVLVLEIFGLGIWGVLTVMANGAWMSGGGRKGLSLGWKLIGWKEGGDWRCV